MQICDLTNKPRSRRVISLMKSPHLKHEKIVRTFDKIKKSLAFLFELFVVTLNKCSAKRQGKIKAMTSLLWFEITSYHRLNYSDYALVCIVKLAVVCKEQFISHRIHCFFFSSNVSLTNKFFLGDKYKSLSMSSRLKWLSQSQHKYADNAIVVPFV